MEKKMIELYSPKEIALLKKKRNVWIGIAVAVAVLALAFCIFFCARTDTSNRDRMLLGTIISSTLGGWIVITLTHFVIEDYRNAEKHIVAVLEGPREYEEGPFEWTGEHLRVRKGISMTGIRKVGAVKGNLYLYDAKKKSFQVERAVRVCTVYGFVAAYEVSDDLD